MEKNFLSFTGFHVFSIEGLCVLIKVKIEVNYVEVFECSVWVSLS